MDPSTNNWRKARTEHYLIQKS